MESAIASHGSLPGPLEIVASAEPDPERQLLHKETRQALASAIRALPATYRMVFLLREVKELSTAEVAITLKITEQCTKTRLHRAKALLISRLRSKLAPSVLPGVTAP